MYWSECWKQLPIELVYEILRFIDKSPIIKVKFINGIPTFYYDKLEWFNERKKLELIKSTLGEKLKKEYKRLEKNNNKIKERFTRITDFNILKIRFTYKFVLKFNKNKNKFTLGNMKKELKINTGITSMNFYEDVMKDLNKFLNKIYI